MILESEQMSDQHLEHAKLFELVFKWKVFLYMRRKNYKRQCLIILIVICWLVISRCKVSFINILHFTFRWFCGLSIQSQIGAYYTNLNYQHVHQGVQKISKIVINGSILITRFAIERLDKNKLFQKKIKRKYVKNFGWAVIKWSKRHYLFFWQ